MKKIISLSILGFVCLLLVVSGKSWDSSKKRISNSECKMQECQFNIGDERVAIGLVDANGIFGNNASNIDARYFISISDSELGEDNVSICYMRKEDISVYTAEEGLIKGSVWGVKETFFEDCGFLLQKGKGMTKRDIQEEKRIALVDQRAASILFSEEEAVGKIIEIEQIPFQVIGITDFPENINSGGMVFIPEIHWPELYQFEDPQIVILWEENEDVKREATKRIIRKLNSILPEEAPLSYGVIR